MMPDRSEGKEGHQPSESLREFLEAFRSEGDGALGRPPATEGYLGFHENWRDSRPIGRGHSARDWRQEWAVQHRPPMRESRSWKALWLGLALVAAVVLSVYGVWRIDQRVHQGVVPPELTAEHTIPVIHWGGQ